MNVYWKRWGFGWAIILAMFAVAVWQWPSAPANIPTHWNGAGAIDRYGSKFEGLLLTPLIAAILWALFPVLPTIGPEQFDVSLRRALLFLGYACLLMFIYAFTKIVLWVNGISLNGNYSLLLLLPIYATLINLIARVIQKSRRRGARAA